MPAVKNVRGYVGEFGFSRLDKVESGRADEGGIDSFLLVFCMEGTLGMNIPGVFGFLKVHTTDSNEGVQKLYEYMRR